MTPRIVFTDEAIQDLTDIYDYLLPRAGATVAADYVGNLYRYCTSLSLFPERGTKRDDLQPGLRLTGYKRRATIAFLTSAETVMIVRVFNRGRQTRFEE